MVAAFLRALLLVFFLRNQTVGIFYSRGFFFCLPWSLLASMHVADPAGTVFSVTDSGFLPFVFFSDALSPRCVAI